MHDFRYIMPETLEEASRLGSEPGSALLAGGQTLLRELKHRRLSPENVIKISHLLSRAIELRGDRIRIGAGVTHAEVADSQVVRENLPMLAGLASHIGDPPVRNRATLGGSLAAYEVAGDYPAACLALGAIVHSSRRDHKAEEFLVKAGRTALEPGEIILAVTFPIPAKAAYVKFLNPAARYPMVGVFAALTAEHRPILAVTAASLDGASRWRQAEDALSSNFAAEMLRGVSFPTQGLVEDVFADANYRRELVEVLARRAVNLANAHGSGVEVASHGSPLQRSWYSDCD